MSEAPGRAAGPAHARGLPWVWGATPQEVAADYRCDQRARRRGGTARRAVRAVSVAASPGQVYAWLGNLRVAPYSYDWVDNAGRRSPRALRSDLGALETGQRVMTIFTAVHVVEGAELTLELRPGPARWVFGEVLVTYAVRPAGAGARLVAVLSLGPGSPAACSGWRGRLGTARQHLLAWGDLVMMRKQLQTLRDLAEGGRSARRP
ncbi:SRPBCC family protein [Serinicoccus sp. LYQ131]|uniref:SRPBCC family protein n=1 Tax=Serinicoccus sp. LYQ131 TaxID=3378797 RepID=UPI0038543B09